MTAPQVPTLPLRSGGHLPQIGLGTWPMTGAECTDAVLSALEVGYRLFDTAENYENEDAVGAAVNQSSVPRQDIFLTTKFNAKWHGKDLVRQALEEALERLGLDYVDLLLIHWPNPGQDRYVDAFEGMVALQEEGLARALGTSNFLPAHLDRLAAAGFVPELNQIELDPTRPRTDVVDYHRDHDILTQAWSPLGLDHREELTSAPAIAEAAQALGRTPEQIVLRWEVQQAMSAVPKSANPDRQRTNLSVFDFELSPAQMEAISALQNPDAEILHPERFGH